MFYASPYKVELDSFTELRIETTNTLLSVKLEQNQNIYELNYTPTEFGYIADLSSIELELQTELFVHLDNRYKQHIEFGMITTTAEFDYKFASNLELGAIYSKDSTTFRVWTPVASSVVLVIANNQYINMNGDGKHYQVTVCDDLVGKEYYYIVSIAGKYNKVVDPYALNTTLNTAAGIVVDRKKYQIDHDYKPNNKSTMVIYETSVCDFTSDVNCDFEYPGKFVGFNQAKAIKQTPIGIDYVKQLGITHIQLMPIYDFGSVNEQFTADNNYNWGYDPVHYNVPEGSYTVGTEFDSRIIECQQMIKQIKEQGIGVIMDVVYNHVYDPNTFNYNLLVPNYYFRFKPNREYSNGSFCGNEVASERAMVRRYIIDSLTTWATIYGIDGIRIDLMGLMDIETIKQIEIALQTINPNFIIYGEGWNMEGMLKASERAAQINADKLPSVGHFNDDLRNFIKGDNSDYDKHGYIQGNRDQANLELILSGKPLDNNKKYVNHYQLINYLSCHDDHTLYDYLKINEQDEMLLTAQIIEGYELLFAARGIPFIHAGCEFKRTKGGAKNTYNSSRQLNSIKWEQVLNNQVIIKRISELIKGRK